MPTYEYRCPKGHHFDLFQRMSDEPTADCPECGKAAERLLSAGAGFLFKGGGFYITDYRSDSYQKAAKAEGKKDSSGSGGEAKDKGTGSGTGSSSASDSGSGSGKKSSASSSGDGSASKSDG